MDSRKNDRTGKPLAGEHEDRAYSRNSSTFSKAKASAAALLLVLSLGFGFLGGWLGSNVHNNGLSSTSTQKEVVLSEGQLVSNIAKTVGKSVVSINATQQAQSSSNDLFGFLGGGQGGSTQSQQDAGTGIIISSDGVILTNRHVVPAGTTKVSVTLSNGTTSNNVKVIGRTNANDSLDVAFLKITDTQGQTLTPATLGNSSKVQIGDRVVAIGNALGQFQNTVTSGIISGHGRTVQASDSGSGANAENLQDLFQTDAAINEGNSGGPLVNASGEVIGLNTAIAGNAQSIGFAIPINDISGLVKSVLSTGKFQQPYLGVLYIPITNGVAKQYNLSVTNGAYIVPVSQSNGQASVVKGSPAAKAGLQAKDIITSVDGSAINESHSLTSLLDQHQVGDTVSLKVIRGGKNLNISVKLDAAPTS